MAYKRYFYKNGKKIGPYYYESYRDDNGKIKKSYLGTKNPNEEKNKSSSKRIFNNFDRKKFFLILLILFSLSLVIIFSGKIIQNQKEGITGISISGKSIYNIINFVENPITKLMGLSVSDEPVSESPDVSAESSEQVS